MARSAASSSSSVAVAVRGTGTNRSGLREAAARYHRTGAVAGTSASTRRARRAQEVYGQGASPGLRARRKRLPTASHSGLIAILVRARVDSSSSIWITPQR